MFDICSIVTPRVRTWALKDQGFASAAEKLLLNMVPVHLLEWPAELSENDIADMAGNTMHLKAVGFAVLIALSLVEWGPAAASRPHSEDPCRRAKPPREIK